VLNSLTPVRTMIHAIRRSLEEFRPGEENAELIEDISKNADLIERRTRDLGDFVQRYREITRINEISLQRIRLLPLFEEVKGIFLGELKDRGIRCTLGCPGSLEADLDPGLFKQVLINLVKNSLDALEGKGNGEILLLADAVQEELQISVQDNGPGIKEEFLEEIFTPFFSTREQGSGIGLSFSRHIVRLHTGRMSIRSKEGEGTTVSIKI